MQSKVKLTKRQIKEDKFATFVLSSKSKVMENWQFYAIGAAAVVLIIAVAIYWGSSQTSTKSEAGGKLAQALIDYRTGNTQVAILSLNQIVDDYSSDDAAEQATFLLGRLNYSQKNYAEATRYYTKYLDTFKADKYRRAGAIGGIAACLENQGQYAEAAAKFSEAVTEDPDGAMAGEHLLGAMRNYLAAGDVTNAKTRLDTLDAKLKGTDLALRADRLFAEKAPAQAGS